MADNSAHILCMLCDGNGEGGQFQIVIKMAAQNGNCSCFSVRDSKRLQAYVQKTVSKTTQCNHKWTRLSWS